MEDMEAGSSNSNNSHNPPNIAPISGVPNYSVWLLVCLNCAQLFGTIISLSELCPATVRVFGRFLFLLYYAFLKSHCLGLHECKYDFIEV